MNYFIARRHNPLCVSNDKDYFDAIKVVLFLHIPTDFSVIADARWRKEYSSISPDGGLPSHKTFTLDHACESIVEREKFI